MGKGQLTMGEVTFWREEAKSCEERQKRELRNRNNYPFLINYFEGIDQVNNDATTPNRYMIINEFFPNTNALISEIMYQNPDILLESLKPQAEDGLPLMKSALTYGFEKSEALIENRIALFDMLYAGYCAVEVDQIPSEKPAIDNSSQDILDNPKPGIYDQFKKGVQDIKSMFNQEEAEKALVQSSPQMEANFATVQGTYMRRYDPMDVPLDWRAERIRDRRYNLKKVWMSKAEFDVKYPDFKDQVNADDQRFEYSRHDSMAHNRKVLLYEFQVRLKQDKYRTIIISPTVKTQEIDCFERPYKTNGFNMKIGTLHKYGKLYSISYAQINKIMQDELNNYVRFKMEVAERNIPKVVTDKNKVKDDAKQALRSKFVNDIVEVDGNTTGVITQLQPTTSSFENKELLSIFQDQKKKLWGVPESKISGLSQNQFATDSNIENQGFDTKNIDVQEGLRMLITEEMDTFKDLIATFWDQEIWLKINGVGKVDWYEPNVVANPNNPEQNMVTNPLTDELTGDYMVKIDIASAHRKNREQQLMQMNLFMQQLVAMRQVLIEQGKDINIDEIRMISKEFGWNPDKIFVDHQPALVPTVPTAGGETISPNENASRDAQAKARMSSGSNLPVPTMQ